MLHKQKDIELRAKAIEKIDFVLRLLVIFRLYKYPLKKRALYKDIRILSNFIMKINEIFLY